MQVVQVPLWVRARTLLSPHAWSVPQLISLVRQARVCCYRPRTSRPQRPSSLGHELLQLRLQELQSQRLLPPFEYKALLKPLAKAALDLVTEAAPEPLVAEAEAVPEVAGAAPIGTKAAPVEAEAVLEAPVSQ